MRAALDTFCAAVLGRNRERHEQRSGKQCPADLVQCLSGRTRVECLNADVKILLSCVQLFADLSISSLKSVHAFKELTQLHGKLRSAGLTHFLTVNRFAVDLPLNSIAIAALGSKLYDLQIELPQTTRRDVMGDIKFPTMMGQLLALRN